MNMVDSAFERVDVAHSHSNNEIVLWHLLVFENKHKKGPVFEKKVLKKTLDSPAPDSDSDGGEEKGIS